MSIHVKSTIHDEAPLTKGQNIYARRVVVVDDGDDRSHERFNLSLGISTDSSYPLQTRISSSVWTENGWAKLMSYRHDSFGDLPNSHAYAKNQTAYDQQIEDIYDKMISDAVKILIG